MRKTVVLIAVAALVGTATVWAFRRGGDDDVSYRLVTVERGDLEEVVSSTGTLEATTTVQVGTQVSGTIAAIYADFNDRVRAGQTIAVIDTTLLASAVKIAAADLERANAELRHAEREMTRIEALHARELISEADLNQQQYQLDVARAGVTSARVALERAEQNLEYATIEAPISGTVIERNVDVGQTVAASLSAPQLFLIANDLSRMQILVAVDESDVGLIKEGQTARFTVQAYDDVVFTGTVQQVRLQSTVEENVVNYTVVVDADNQGGRLLPGMTATVDFLIATANDALTVPNAALRFRPTEAMMAELHARRQADARPEHRRSSEVVEQGEQEPEGTPEPGLGGDIRQAGGTGHRGTPPADLQLLYYLDDEGKPAVAPVRTGITDGQKTEIESPVLEAGMQVIVGVSGGSSAATSSSSASNPFQGQQRGGGPPRRGPHL